jgi:uncharacterized protein (TIGR03000 family)
MIRFVVTLAFCLTAASAGYAAPGGRSFSSAPARGVSRAPSASPNSSFLNRGLSRGGYGAYGYGYGAYGYGGYGYGGYGYGGYGYGGYLSGGFAPGGYDGAGGYSSNNINIYNVLPPQPYVPFPGNLAVPAPQPNDHPATARLTLQVPTGAEVTVNGKKVDAGSKRIFESPDLQTGESFTFDVRVTWLEDGKAVKEARSLTMHPGDHQSLQYLAAPTAPIKVERVEK